MTAVEWLIEELKKVHHPTEAMIMYAKKLEKQQIIDAWWNGHDTRDNSLIHPSEDCNGYYNETYGSKGSDETKVVEFDHLKKEVTSSQTEISEHRFTEKDIRFAYMQGYNRGVDGNSNHMESYIEHLKSTKSSQTEISDEEMMYSEDDVCNFVEWMNLHYRALEHTISLKDVNGTKELLQKWYREQLKKKQ